MSTAKNPRAGIIKGFLWKWFQRLALAGAVLLLILIILVAVTPQGRTGFHTALFVLQILDAPVTPQGWFTGTPVRYEVTYPVGNGTGVADLYRIPDDNRRAAVLLFLGANAAGRDDADVITLGNALARAGYVAMFHWSPTMALQHNVDKQELDNLVWAFQYLQSQDFVDPQQTGMGGFCVGASFALVAASDPRISHQVEFVNAFGPYYDAQDLLVQVGGRSSFHRWETHPWQTDPLTLRVVANELIETIERPSERRVLQQRFIDGQPVDPSELDALSEYAQGVRQLLEGTTLEEAYRLYQFLPLSFQQDMQSISPAAHINRLEAKVLVLHDRDDQLVPVEESRRLEEALQQGGNYRYTELQSFDHVRPGESSIFDLLGEGYRLARHMYAIIRIAQ